MRQPPPTAVGIPSFGEITQKLGTSSEKRSVLIDRRLSVAPMMDWTH